MTTTLQAPVQAHTRVTAPVSPLSRDEGAFLDTGSPDAFVRVYAVHRAAVLDELVRLGLDTVYAESFIGEVFVRLMDERAVIDRGRPLEQTLRGLACRVDVWEERLGGNDPSW